MTHHRQLSEIQAEAQLLANVKDGWGDLGGVEGLTAAGMFGAAYGWSVATSTQMLHIIDGAVELRPEAMLALIRQAGHSVQYETERQDGDPLAVAATGKRSDNGDTNKVVFTLKDAERSGLTDSPLWKQSPEALLTWRAVALLARRLFSDVLLGANDTPQATDPRRPALTVHESAAASTSPPPDPKAARQLIHTAASNQTAMKYKDLKHALLAAVSQDKQAAQAIWEDCVGDARPTAAGYRPEYVLNEATIRVAAALAALDKTP